MKYFKYKPLRYSCCLQDCTFPYIDNSNIRDVIDCAISFEKSFLVLSYSPDICRTMQYLQKFLITLVLLCIYKKRDISDMCLCLERIFLDLNIKKLEKISAFELHYFQLSFSC